MYFAQWLTIERGVSEFWYNMLFVGGTILVVLIAPVYGFMADRRSSHLKFLRISTIITYLLFIIIALSTNLKPEWVVFSSVVYLVGNAVYQISFSFYNPLINELSTQDKRGFISGLGHMANWAGQIIGILLAIYFASTTFIFSTPGRAQTFLPSALIFVILSLPMLFFFKQKKGLEYSVKINYVEATKSVLSEFKALWKIPNIKYFFLSYFFFNDAILTASNNFPLYLERVFGLPDEKKSLLMAGILVMAALGAFIGGWVSDKKGLKKTNLILLGLWILILPSFGLTNNFTVFSVVALCMGLVFGATGAVSRALLSNILPKKSSSFCFGIYSISERFASFAGPLTWGLIILLPYTRALNYRIAIIAMTVFVIIGFYYMKKVTEEKYAPQSSQ